MKILFQYEASTFIKSNKNCIKKIALNPEHLISE